MCPPPSSPQATRDAAIPTPSDELGAGTRQNAIDNEGIMSADDSLQGWDLLASVVSDSPPPSTGLLSSTVPTLPLSMPVRVLAGPLSVPDVPEWRPPLSSSFLTASPVQEIPRASSSHFPPPVLVARSALGATANPDGSVTADGPSAPTTTEQSLSHPGSWQIILVNNDARQIVLYNRRSHALAIQTAHSPLSSPTHAHAVSASAHSPNTVVLSSPPPRDLRHHHQHHPCCPMCGRAFAVGQLPAPSPNIPSSQFDVGDQDDDDNGELEDPMDVDQPTAAESPASSPTSVGGGQMIPMVTMPTYQDRDYFRLLANVHSTYPIASTASVASSPPDSPTRGASPDPFTTSSLADQRHPVSPTITGPHEPSASSSASTTTPGVNVTSFNQGYYSRFFHELGKLGRGAHGAVYLCRHVLDDIPLGEYAIKKVAVGNNHPWLSRLLREVTLLERLRHPNIIAYKHAWLEHAQHSTFGPLVPSLFILMERANGGNLEDFLLPEGEDAPEAGGSVQGGKAGAVKARKRAARVSALPKLPAAWSEIGPEGGWAVGAQGQIVRVLGVKSVIKVVLGVARGLGHLHKLGVVHRDLKPPNILLSWESEQGMSAGAATASGEESTAGAEASQDDGAVPQDAVEPGAVPPTNKIPIPLIADFGEFDVISNPSAADRTGNTGTIDFTAPECLKRDHLTGRFLATYSTKADVWSLGLIALYVAFAGHVPFVHRADVDKLREEIVTCDPTSLVGSMAAGVNPQRVPKAFMALVAQCLNKEPGQRPTASKVVHVLERMLAQLEGDDGSKEMGGEVESTVGSEDTIKVDTASGLGASYSAAGISGDTQQTTRRGRSQTFAASGSSTTRSTSSRKTTWDYGDLHMDTPAGASTMRTRSSRAVSLSGVRIRPIPSSSIDSPTEPGEATMPVQVPLPALLPPPVTVPPTSLNTWITAGARIAQVAAIMAVPSQVPTNVSVALTCCALATTEWLVTTATDDAHVGTAQGRVRTGVLGGLIVHFVALAGVSWAYASGRVG